MAITKLKSKSYKVEVFYPKEVRQILGITNQRFRKTYKTKKEAENAKIAVRNIRRDAMEAYKKQEKAGDITEDDLRESEKEVQTATDNSIKEIDAIAAEKEQELLEV